MAGDCVGRLGTTAGGLHDAGFRHPGCRMTWKYSGHWAAAMWFHAHSAMDQRWRRFEVPLRRGKFLVRRGHLFGWIRDRQSFVFFGGGVFLTRARASRQRAKRRRTTRESDAGFLSLFVSLPLFAVFTSRRGGLWYGADARRVSRNLARDWVAMGMGFAGLPVMCSKRRLMAPGYRMRKSGGSTPRHSNVGRSKAT